MTSFKLFQEDYDSTAADGGTVTIMTDATHGDFFLVRDGIPSEREGEVVDDPGIRISAEDMEAFCRAALVYIEAFKTKQKDPDDNVGKEEEPEPDVKAMNIFDAMAYKNVFPHISQRLFSRIQAMFSQKAWEELTIGDIISVPRSEWLKQRGFGRKALDELDTLLENIGVWNDWIKR